MGTLKFAILITLILALAVICFIEKPITIGVCILVGVYAAFIFTLLKKEGGLRWKK
jgi:hypothetical protein